MWLFLSTTQSTNRTSPSDFNSISRPPCPHFPLLIILLNNLFFPGSKKQLGYERGHAVPIFPRVVCVTDWTHFVSSVPVVSNIGVSTPFCQSLITIGLEKLMAHSHNYYGTVGIEMNTNWKRSSSLLKTACLCVCCSPCIWESFVFIGVLMFC